MPLALTSSDRCCPRRHIPSTPSDWWRGLDSNQRTPKRADLQSAAFNRSATPPRSLAARRSGLRVLRVLPAFVNVMWMLDLRTMRHPTRRFPPPRTAVAAASLTRDPGPWLYGRHAVAAALANKERRVRRVVALARCRRRAPPPRRRGSRAAPRERRRGARPPRLRPAAAASRSSGHGARRRAAAGARPRRHPRRHRRGGRAADRRPPRPGHRPAQHRRHPALGGGLCGARAGPARTWRAAGHRRPRQGGLGRARGGAADSASPTSRAASIASKMQASGASASRKRRRRRWRRSIPARAWHWYWAARAAACAA